MRLVLHTAAYWLMLSVRDAIPKAHRSATAEFATLRLRLLKLGARVIETASRVRLAFAAACSGGATRSAISPPRSPQHLAKPRGRDAPTNPLPQTANSQLEIQIDHGGKPRNLKLVRSPAAAQTPRPPAGVVNKTG